MKTALAHHWLVTMRGGEKVLEQLCQMFPAAPVYTLIHQRGSVSREIENRSIHESRLASLPASRRRHRAYLAFFPWATRTLRVPDDTELVISSDASVVKGLQYSSGVCHICYCHSPPRYLWDQHEAYLEHTGGLGPIGRSLFRAVTPRVREFDRRAAQRVDYFIANSEFVKARIARCYGKDADVIPPPVDTTAFTATAEREPFYLMVAELVGYKRVDLAVEAFGGLKRELIVIGDGPELVRLRRRAKDNIRFLGRQSSAVTRWHFERCRALIHPQIEDFGIAAVEAQAAGAPVIAFAEGGASESVIPNETGLFFYSQTPASLRESVLAFEKMSFDPLACQRNAGRFAVDCFRSRLQSFFRRKMPELASRLFARSNGSAVVSN